MVFRFMTFDVDDEYLNNHPGSPPYYGPCPSFSSSESSAAVGYCNGCLRGISGLTVAQTSASQVQVNQSQNRGRERYNNLLKLISHRIRGRANDSNQEEKGELVLFDDCANDSNQEEKGELVLFDDCSWAFGLEDLLRASAKVLPESPERGYKVSLGDLLRASGDELKERLHWSTTYKVCMEDSTAVVVKKMKNGNVTMTQLEEHMELLGQIRHENVAPLRGYCILRDGTLMLYDYNCKGSVYSAIQGMRRRFLNWDMRCKIVIGAVRGIAYIHEQNGGKLFHGNLTSSNVFINSQGYGCILEICCNTLKSGESPYSCCNPNMREASQASDIYGLGLLMLKLLFGNNPLEASGVISSKYYDQTDDIYNFDEGLPYWECMLMLNLALDCMTIDPDKRPNIKELVEIVENL